MKSIDALRRSGALAAALAMTLAGCGPEPPLPRAWGSDTGSPEAGNGTQNRAPQILGLALDPAEPRPGETVRARADVRDPDGDKVALVYTWFIDGRPQSNRGSSLLVEDVRKGERIELEVIARDGLAESAPIRASARAGNQPPLVLDVALEPSSGASRATDLTALPRSRDPDDDALEHRYRWRVNGKDVGVRGGSLPADAFGRGDKIELSVVAFDGEDESAPFRVEPIEVSNAPPKIVSLPEGLDEHGVFTYRIHAEDPDGERHLRYELIEGPRGMNLDVADGELRWRPTASQAGAHDVTVQVADPRGAKSRQSFQLHVAVSGGAPAEVAP